MIEKITFETLDKWGACCRGPGEKYDDEHLKARGWPDEGRTPLELSTQRWIPVEDRVWGLLRPEILGDDFQSVLDEIVDYVVEEYCLNCGMPESEAWAGKWLSGEDRSVGNAWAMARAARVTGAIRRATAGAAEEAARAAWAAARAAWAAARATAGAAEEVAWAADAAVWAAAEAAAEAARAAAEAAEAAAEAAEAARAAAWAAEAAAGAAEAARAAAWAAEKERHRQLRIIRKYLRRRDDG